MTAPAYALADGPARARELTKSYGSVRALDGVSFEIGEGITGLLGSNGAGKTTSLKLFMGLIDPDSGSAEVLGQDPRVSPEFRARIGYGPEHDCLPAGVSAAEFLAYMAEVSGLPRTAARLRASDMLRHVGLFEERYRPMGTYSTGMKQRVKLAQALVHDPLLAFLDEPTAGLDPIGRREMLELIRRVGRDFGISIVISTHLMGDVERACDSVVVLDAGRLLRTGAVSGLTEETEALEIDLVEDAAALQEALAARGLELAPRRQPRDARAGHGGRLRRDPRRDRRVGRPPLPPRSGAAHARGRLLGGTRRRRRWRGRGGVTTGPAEIFDLGYRGYEGERTSRWRRRLAIWRDGVRISLGLGRSAGAKFASWLLIGLALVPIVVLVVISAFLSPAEERAGGLRAALVRRLLRLGDRAARALRGGRRAAAALPRPPRRRPGALRGAADHPDRLRRLPLGRLPHGLGGRGVAPGRGPVHLERARRARARARGSATTGTSCRGPSPPAAAVAALMTTLSLFTASYAKRRAYAAVATLAVLFVGSAIGGIAEENFTGPWRDARLAGGAAAGRRRHGALDLRRRRRRPPAPGMGVRRSGWRA